MHKKFGLPFLILSLAIHLGVFTGLQFVDQEDLTVSKDEIIEVEYIPASEVKKTRQIVEQDENRLNEETPDDEYFMGRHNQVVKKQTRAAKVGEMKNATGKAEQGKDTGAGPKAQAKPKVATKDGQQLQLKNLVPNYTFNQQQDPSKSGKASTQDDHLKDIAVGMETQLSTREYLYYTYFNRIKSKLRQRWGPKVREKVTKMAQRGRTIASTQTRITKVIIVLNQGGNLVTVKVIGQSGVIDLDEAAIEAFRSAAPFPNPPRGMMDGDGNVRITWDFVLEA